MNHRIPTCLSSRLGLSLALVLASVSLPALALAQTAPAPARAAAPAAAPPAVRPKPAAQAAADPRPPATQGLASTRSAGGEDVIARVGDANVSAEEIRSYMAALAPRDQAALAKDPGLLSQAVRMLLANRLVLQELAAKKWDKQPAVEEQLTRLRDNALVELYLQSVTVPPTSFPSDDEVQKFYDANHPSMVVPRQFQLAQIFVADARDADKATDDKAKTKLAELVKKLKAPGADFAAIAGDGDTPAASDLGWLPEPQIVPEIRAQVAGLAKGAVSEPVRLDDGWHILKLTDTKASYTRPLSEVRDQLVAQMRADRATAIRRAYLAELLRQHPPAINELALSKVLGDQTPAAR